MEGAYDTAVFEAKICLLNLSIQTGKLKCRSVASHEIGVNT